jgi:hypothetical protein
MPATQSRPRLPRLTDPCRASLPHDWKNEESMGIGIIPKHVDITLISAWLAEEKRSVIQESVMIVDLFDFVMNLLIFLMVFVDVIGFSHVFNHTNVFFRVGFDRRNFRPMQRVVVKVLLASVSTKGDAPGPSAGVAAQWPGDGSCFLASLA